MRRAAKAHEYINSVYVRREKEEAEEGEEVSTRTYLKFIGGSMNIECQFYHSLNFQIYTIKNLKAREYEGVFLV